MSEHDLSFTGQYEVNAKTPNAVAAVQTDACNMKVGKAWNHELAEFHYGFVAKGYGYSDMGRISENFEIVDGFPLVYFQIQGTNELVHLDFDGEQPFSATEITLTVGDADPIVLTWDAPNFNYASPAVPGLGAIIKSMVGGTYKFNLEVTAP